MEFVSLIVAAAVGGLAATALQVFYTAKAQDKRNAFSERKEAYVGLWEAFYRQDIAGYTKDSEFDVGHWMLRCELVASRDVLKKLEIWTDTKPGSDERKASTKSLRAAMRDDLGIAKRNL